MGMRNMCAGAHAQVEVIQEGEKAAEDKLLMLSTFYWDDPDCDWAAFTATVLDIADRAFGDLDCRYGDCSLYVQFRAEGFRT